MSIIEFIESFRSGWTITKAVFTVAIVLIIAGTIIFLIDPGKQLIKYRNQQRRADANELIAALNLYVADHNGDIPIKISTEAKDICSGNGEACGDFVDLSFLIDKNKYLKKLPTDPRNIKPNSIGYTVAKSENGRITISAPLAEKATINVTR